jgi:amidase
VIDLINGDSTDTDIESTSPAAVAGYPHITVPAGYLFGLPVGISFFAKAWQEPALIKFAYAFEQATQFRRQPRYLSTATLNP